MKSLPIIATLTLAILLPLGAQARTRLPSRVELRQIIQDDQIRDAKLAGELTEAELGALAEEQDMLEQKIRRFRGDGFFSERELAVLDFLQDAASRHLDRSLVPEGDEPTGERTAKVTGRTRRGRRR